MKKIAMKALSGPLGQRVSASAIKHAAKATDMPGSMKTDLLKKAEDSAVRKDVVAVALWSMRHKHQRGHMTTSVDPVGFCGTLNDVAYCIGTIKGSSNNNLSPHSIEVLSKLKASLIDPNLLGAHGTLQARRELTDEIDTILRGHLDVSSADGSQAIQDRMRFALEDRTAEDADVRDLVTSNLQAAVDDRLSFLNQKAAQRNSPEHMVTIINLQREAEALGVSLFVSGITLLALIRDGQFCLRRKELNLGLIDHDDDFEALRDLVVSNFEFTVIEHSAPDDVIKLKHSSGIPVNIWRYRRDGAHYVARDHVHVHVHRIFNIAQHTHNGLKLNIPADYDQYLTEMNGADWAIPKLSRNPHFDIGNLAYTDRAEALEFLTNSIVIGLGRNRRRIVQRAMEDLNDYFDIDYMGYVPIRNFEVDTPATRLRNAREEAATSPLLLLLPATYPNVDQLARIRSQINGHDVIIAGIVAGDKSPNSKTKTALIKAYASIKGINRAQMVETAEDISNLGEDYPDIRVARIDIPDEGAAALGLDAQSVEQPEALEA